jgi:redox-sensitive bicupin YhaK (pirin superfamily)
MPNEIYQAEGRIENGTFRGRWHFSFGEYHDPHFVNFGMLRVFNDDTLSPGAVWPLHPHVGNEVVTYCAEGVFRHADERGRGGLLKKGWVQHTTVGTGLWHSEINELQDEPLRFIQMWFMPRQAGLPPSVEQKAVTEADRTGRLLPLVSNRHPEALPINADAEVYSSRLETGAAIDLPLEPGRGAYLYVVEGGPVVVDSEVVPEFGAAMIAQENKVRLKAEGISELLILDVKP